METLERDPEEWAKIEDFDYEISNWGNFRRYSTKAILKLEELRSGYLRATMSKNNKRERVLVHELVAKYFVHNDDPEHKTQVNHVNENKKDNYHKNLVWTTPSENINHGTGNQRRSEKLQKEKPGRPVRRSDGVEFRTIHEAARETPGTTAQGIWNALNNYNNWTHTCGDYSWEYIKNEEN